MRKFQLHRLVREGRTEPVRAWLSAPPDGERIEVNAYDDRGYTPLMYAVESPGPDVDLLRLLLDHGARIDMESRRHVEIRKHVLALALGAGSPEKVSVLLEAGADLHYVRKDNYDALVDSVYGRDVLRDPNLPALLRLLIARGAFLNSVTGHQESGLRVLSRLGRFDAVAILLAAGADADHLGWTPLIRAVAIGSVEEMEHLLDAGESLEARDWWTRTPWLLALQTGDLAKAQLLLGRGADVSARGRCGKPPLHYAIENHQAAMLRWLLDLGLDIEQTDEFATTPLMQAVESDDAECVAVLLRAGATVEAVGGQDPPLINARSRTVARLLLDAGSDPAYLPFAAQRALLGFTPDSNRDLLTCSLSEFSRARTRRFGAANPERIEEPFWECMIRAGVSGYTATKYFDGPSSRKNGPVWCADRFGQSLTFLPDARVVQIAGEHEDYYDQDFCIYNDIFVHHPDGEIRIFGYPEDVFPPTDFHTATLVGQYIYVIGSLGYPEKRSLGETQLYRLDINTFRIERLLACGDAPGWLHRHRASLISPHEIRVRGGEILEQKGDAQTFSGNARCFILDTVSLRWRLESV